MPNSDSATGKKGDNTILPEYIVFPHIKRERGGSDILPKDVEGVDDLPKRFYLGSIDCSTFEITKDGWHVQYRDADGSYDHVEYKDGGSLFVKENWQGQFERFFTSPASHGFAFSSQVTSTDFPGPWEEHAQKVLEGRYNLKYFPTQKNQPLSCAFPDGYNKSILVPIPIDMLDKVESCLQAIDKDIDVQTYVTATVKLVTSTVNYIIGRNDDVMTSPYDLMDKTLYELGLPATAIPEVQHAQDSSALTVQRLHYLLDISVFFRDLIRVVEYLNRFGLLGDKNDTHQNTYPDAPEYSAILLNSLAVPFSKDIFYFDDAVTRRTYYSRLGDEKDIYRLLENPSEEDIQAKIDAAKNKSEAIKAQLSTLAHRLMDS